MNPRLAVIEDSDVINSICSHPEVRRWTAQDDSPPFNVAPWFSGENFPIVCDGGVFLFQWVGDGIYSVHVNFLPEARGKRAFMAGNLTLLKVFTTMKVETLVFAIPQGNRMADGYARGMGCRPTFKQWNRWLKDGRLQDINYYRLDIDDWIGLGLLKSIGEAFREEMAQLGLNTHPKDTVYDSYIGAACSMLAGGQQIKALKLYNRWARLAGYKTWKFISQVPLEIDAEEFLLVYRGGQLKVQQKEKVHG
jgi:hypothetical protein